MPTASGSMRSISVVVPVSNRESSLTPLIEGLEPALRTLCDRFDVTSREAGHARWRGSVSQITRIARSTALGTKAARNVPAARLYERVGFRAISLAHRSHRWPCADPHGAAC